MNDTRFDTATRAIRAGAIERRDSIKGLLGAGLGLALGGLALGQQEAKGKKKKKPCPPACTRCSDGNDSSGCCRIECCPGINEPDGGQTFCRAAHTVCCSAEESGGSCSRDFPFCCAGTPENPDGFCSSTADGCSALPRGAAAGGNSGRAPRIGRRW